MKATNKQVFCCFLTIIATFNFQIINSLDLESAREGRKCTELHTVPVDLSWVSSVTRWYYVVMSRLDAYLYAIETLGKEAKDIREDELYYNGCFSWKLDFQKLLFKGIGFGGKPYVLEYEMLDKHFSKFDARKSGEHFLQTFTTLTDNKTFVFYATCVDSVDEMVWVAGSPYKALPDESIQTIFNHAESLGFKKEQFAILRHDNCVDLEGDNAKSEDVYNKEGVDPLGNRNEL